MYLSMDFPAAYLNLVSELSNLSKESASLKAVSKEISGILDVANDPNSVVIDIMQIINTSVPCDPICEERLEPLFEVFEKHGLYTREVLRKFRKINVRYTKDEQATTLTELVGLVEDAPPILQYAARFAVLTRMCLFGLPSFPADMINGLIDHLKTADDDVKKAATMLPSQLFPVE